MCVYIYIYRERERERYRYRYIYIYIVVYTYIYIYICICICIHMSGSEVIFVSDWRVGRSHGGRLAITTICCVGYLFTYSVRVCVCM